ncbi:MAG: hypothetical protein R2688_07280 [Fimbriimonadaceae bacterium]
MAADANASGASASIESAGETLTDKIEDAKDAVTDGEDKSE